MIPGTILLFIAVALIAFVLFHNTGKSYDRLIFAPSQVLRGVWNGYKKEYLEPGTLRTLDKQRGNITTSEGQSYTMLRAVWMSDQETFDGSWKWTKDNLQHKNDHLFSWLFGKLPNGTYGVLTNQGGQNSASDADSDIALALTLAYARWQDPRYLDAARAIVSDIWEKEVITINGTPYLAANDLEKTSPNPTVIVNPSYLSPASYRLFAKIDPQHPWLQLAEATYPFLNRTIDAPLNATSTAGLPPNWVAVNRTSGALSAVKNPDLTTNYGYDAFRTPWRLALDHQWFRTPAAEDTLERMSFLSRTWNAQHALAAEYTHAGTPVVQAEAPAMYGTAIGYFMVADPAAARAIYEKKLTYLFDGGMNNWYDTLSYYDSNWAWFGIALYTKQLPNLAAALPTIK
jgi:endoglucanase